MRPETRTLDSDTDVALSLLSLRSPTVEAFPSHVDTFRVRVKERAIRHATNVESLSTGIQGETRTATTEVTHVRTQRQIAVERIQSYGNLKPDWGEPGHRVPTPNAVTDALRFLSLVPRDAELPRIAPSGDGEINFCWKGAGLYIDVGFCGDGRIDYYARNDHLGLDNDGSEGFSGESIPENVLSAIPLL